MIRLLATALLMLWGAAASAQTLYVHSPGDGYLNLREGPGSNHRIIDEMYHGEAVDVLRWGEGWHRVRHESGRSGWASARYLQPNPNLTHLVVNSPGDGFLNLREGPGTSAAVLTRMPHGSRVWAAGARSGKWLLVDHPTSNYQGWAHVGWLSRP